MLEALQRGHPQAAEELLPRVYDELRRIAAHKMAQEPPGHTLQATALMHEAWLRMIGDGARSFAGRAHLFAVAAEAMRRILVESARPHVAPASQRDRPTNSGHCPAALIDRRSGGDAGTQGAGIEGAHAVARMTRSGRREREGCAAGAGGRPSSPRPERCKIPSNHLCGTPAVRVRPGEPLQLPSPSTFRIPATAKLSAR